MVFSLLFVLGLTYKPISAIYINPKTVYSLPDTFQMVRSGDFFNDFLVLLDAKDENVHLYKKNEKLISFGRHGMAPSEFNFMGAGMVRFSPDGEIFVYDGGNSRVQIFSMEGKYNRSIPVGLPSTDFEIDTSYMYFTPMTGNTELIIMDKDGKIVKKFTGGEINLMEEKFPFPIKRIVVYNGKVYFVSLNKYVIKEYFMEKKNTAKFGVKVKPIPFDEEVKKEMIKKVPMLKGRIRKYQFPIADIFIDKSKGVLWVLKTSKDKKGLLFDLFDKNGRYLKRIGLKGLIGYPITIDKGRLAIFTSGNLVRNVKIYDVSAAY
ncbi:hypothetical protein J7L85_03075 [candidate division WOR-3 bacterium]|nr:hypothetical protein [candidate division WOR-3 bacterium]